MDRDIVGREQDQAGLQTAAAITAGGQTVNHRTLVISRGVIPTGIFSCVSPNRQLQTSSVIILHRVNLNGIYHSVSLMKTIKNGLTQTVSLRPSVK